MLKSFLEKHKSILKESEPMCKHTTFRIGGPARYFFAPTTAEELRSVLCGALEEDLNVYPLGAGSNLLVKDNELDGAVIHLAKLHTIHIEKNLVIAGSGFPLAALINLACQHGLGGLETLAGIPSSLGGAVIMNAGGKYGCIGDSVKYVLAIDNKCGLKKLGPRELGFKYRHSEIKNEMIAEVCLELKQADPEELQRRYAGILAEKKLAQPLSQPSAGCVFKNPPNGSAGALIDNAGLKGLKKGGAMISSKHANFIVNAGGAKAADVSALIEKIKQTVFEKSRIKLELEIKVW
ncbi:MAG: UDP-N-acetylmuramate dehydrogenase [Planctomycetes bacterium]|nr:UDP-N-acetylmuramate dehydrogenase [Planctomycetota bacterium]